MVVTVVVDVRVVETVDVVPGAVTVDVGWLTVTCVEFEVVPAGAFPTVVVDVTVLPPIPAATEITNATARPATKATTPAIQAEDRRPVKLWPQDWQ